MGWGVKLLGRGAPGFTAPVHLQASARPRSLLAFLRISHPSWVRLHPCDVPPASVPALCSRTPPPSCTPPIPQVSQVSERARAAIEAAGGSVTTVYYNQLGLRALLKPDWFAAKVGCALGPLWGAGVLVGKGSGGLCVPCPNVAAPPRWLCPGGCCFETPLAGRNSRHAPCLSPRRRAACCRAPRGRHPSWRAASTARASCRPAPSCSSRRRRDCEAAAGGLPACLSRPVI